MKYLAPLLLLASSAHAGGYVGMGMGVSHIDTYDDEPFVLQLAIGYRPVPIIAVEAGYNVYGEQSQPYGTGYTRTEKLEGFTVSVLGIIPLKVLDVYGKIGAVRWQERYDRSGDTIYDDYGYAPMVGAGIGVNITENFALRANLEAFEYDDDKVVTGSIGFTVGF